MVGRERINRLTRKHKSVVEVLQQPQTSSQSQQINHESTPPEVEQEEPSDSQIPDIICELCEEKFKRLKTHLKHKQNCADYYMTKYKKNNLDDLAKFFRNTNRAAKRRETGRSQENVQKRQRRSIENSSVICNANAFNGAIILQNACVFCATYQEGLKQIPVENILTEAGQARVNKFSSNGVAWICKICIKVRSDENRKTPILECLRDLLKCPEPGTVISYLEYRKKNKLSTLFFPVPECNMSEELGGENLEEEFSTCLMQRGKGTLDDQESTISKDSCTLISNHQVVPFGKLISALYLNHNEKMKALENSTGSDIKLGLIKDGILHIPKQKENGKYYLENIRGTDANLVKMTNYNKIGKLQNGQNFIKFKIPLYSSKSGKLEDERLAATLLRTHLIQKVKVKSTIDEQGLKRWFYYIPCSESCDKECEQDHMSADEYFNRNCEVTLSEALTIARYIQAVVNLFVEKFLWKQNLLFDAHLFFEKIGEVFLTGTLHVPEFEEFNRRGQEVTDNNMLPLIFKDVQTFQEMFNFQNECTFEISSEKHGMVFAQDDGQHLELSKHLGDDYLEHYRETSMLEFITLTTPGFQNVWSNQLKAKVDVRDLEDQLEPFRLIREHGDEHEEVFVHSNGSKYAKLSTWRRRHVLKPRPVEHVTLLQLACQFRLHEKVTPKLILELEQNDGIIFGEEKIPVITNEQKFPQHCKYLPKLILLGNKQVLRLKKELSLMIPSSQITPFALRLLVEPFSSDLELQDVPPPLNQLEARFKSILPCSNHEIDGF